MLALLKSLKGSSSYVSSSHTGTSNTDLYDDNFHSLSKVVAGGRNRRAEPVLGSGLCKDYDVNKHKEKGGEKTPGTKRRKKTIIGSGCEQSENFELSTSATEHSSSGFSSTSSFSNLSGCSHFLTPSVTGSPCPDSSLPVWQHSTSSTGEMLKQDASGLFSMQSEKFPGGDGKPSGDAETQTLTRHFSNINTLPAQSHLQLSSGDSCVTRKISYLPRCHSMSSLGKGPLIKNKFTPSNSLPDILFKEFTPVITPDFDDETYRFQCSSPGLYQCTVTGLVFHMTGEGDVVYRIVPWDRRLLGKHHKKPAGPLFDIKCLQQSVCQLHLPHCEIRSTGGYKFLSVAHVNDEGIEFISPHKITETHVVINITGFSGFGNVKDEDSPLAPVRALVLLFYRPSADPDHRSFLSVLLVPRNVVLRDVQRTRRKLIGDEMYIETSPHCKLQPDQVYTLSTCPRDDSVKVQPTEAEFDGEAHSSYFTSFQVILKTIIKDIELCLRDTNSSLVVWEREVCLPSTEMRNSSEQRGLNLPPDERLFRVRSNLVNAISGPVLKSLLDKLFEKNVITDSERESADEMPNKRDKARFVINTVRKKHKSSQMIEFLRELDPCLCKRLGLM